MPAFWVCLDVLFMRHFHSLQEGVWPKSTTQSRPGLGEKAKARGCQRVMQATGRGGAGKCWERVDTSPRAAPPGRLQPQGRHRTRELKGRSEREANCLLLSVPPAPWLKPGGGGCAVTSGSRWLLEAMSSMAEVVGDAVPGRPGPRVCWVARWSC